MELTSLHIFSKDIDILSCKYKQRLGIYIFIIKYSIEKVFLDFLLLSAVSIAYNIENNMEVQLDYDLF